MQKNDKTASSGIGRREFIKTTATAAAAVAATSMLKPTVYGQAPSAGAAGANNKLVIGFIGVGRQGFGAHVRQIQLHATENNVALAAVCDVWKNRVEKVKEAIGS